MIMHVFPCFARQYLHFHGIFQILKTTFWTIKALRMDTLKKAYFKMTVTKSDYGL